MINYSTSEPRVRLAMAPVIALARSEATKAVKFATSASVGKRFSNVPVHARSASMFSTVGRPAQGQLRERRALHVKGADGIERDVDAARFCRHLIGVLIDGLFVKGVNFRCLGDSSCCRNLFDHCIEFCSRPTGKEDLRSLTREGTGYRAANRTAAVDYSVLVLKQHHVLL